MNKITPEIVGGVGDSPYKVELKKKLLGQAKYIDDLYRPNMLHGAILTSPHAHAKIISYNVEAARALPGVKCVITGDDFGDDFMGPFIKDEVSIA